MAYCTSCGEEVSDDATYCANCGERVDGDDADHDSDPDPPPEPEPEDTSSTDTHPEPDSTLTTEDTDEEPAVEEDDGEVSEESRREAVNALKAGAVGFVPGVVGGILIAFVTGIGIVGVIGAWVLFAAVFFQQNTGKEMLGSMFFWIAIELLLWPIAQLIYYAREPGGVSGVDFIAVLMALVLGGVLATVSYLIHSRIDWTPDEAS